MKNLSAVAREAVENGDSPCYIFDIDQFDYQYAYMKKTVGEDIRVNYCMKTNPFLVQEALHWTDRIEVCSYGEFLICKSLTVDPKRLLISGVLKKKEEIQKIVEYGKGEAIYTAESPLQLEYLQLYGELYDLKLRVYLRLTSGNQFGMDETTLIEQLQCWNCYPNLTFYGIHFFSGTQKHKLGKYEKEIRRLDGLIGCIAEETDQIVEHLEYGTGFGVPYFKYQLPTMTGEEQIQEFVGLLHKMKYQGEISLEMGRALAYNCGYYVTKVCDLKESNGKHYCIVDGGIHQIQYDGQIRGMYQPLVTFDGAQSGEEISYTVCGSLCTGNDVLMADLTCRKLSLGDHLIFERVGAYSVYEGMSLFLSHELPTVFSYSVKKGLCQMRRRIESYPLNTPFNAR